ncbi:uncharacterized protein TrAFT101_004077 [Trichoderma asperellum]|uniref:Uncharacterized protein n=1 Tax=Trichoderma asperellum (strain ATCC 204424 / CBS 433.97 / NBRC 101777) TaxID=1042311 RepID=A0A2T3ZNU1_TRIA4|nr:hypothetical protein M441DRAFT_217472 [Trichoderma asperellum CBS 433.97]PTB46467.1 hypothetical protein M441DRAFT_217472 [Trichoderma asperellum CBS 433.97]UKZ88316.1 hypothetical protein TrAFT101_004077 [Trichoderma asperellum]
MNIQGEGPRSLITSDARKERENHASAILPIAMRDTQKPPLPRPMWLSRIIHGHRLPLHRYCLLSGLHHDAGVKEGSDPASFTARRFINRSRKQCPEQAFRA